MFFMLRGKFSMLAVCRFFRSPITVPSWFQATPKSLLLILTLLLSIGKARGVCVRRIFLLVLYEYLRVRSVRVHDILVPHTCPVRVLVGGSTGGGFTSCGLCMRGRDFAGKLYLFEAYCFYL
ncbi:hypothetical protein HOY80DRAFT_518733 [Tuber brumale]|nr:hypothetical protein HOY80DRAFT_518733 [Tuber brumale]